MNHTYRAWHRGIPFFVALLFVSTSALSKPMWLECSGEQKIAAGKPVYSGTIVVMFDRETQHVLIREGSSKHEFKSSAPTVSPVSIYASMFLKQLFIDRDTNTFKLWRFSASYETQSTVTGTCRALTQPPE